MHLNTFQNNYWPKCKTKATRKTLQFPLNVKRRSCFPNYFLNFPPQLMAVMGDGGHLEILQKKHRFFLKLFFEFMVDNCLTFTPWSVLGNKVKNTPTILDWIILWIYGGQGCGRLSDPTTCFNSLSARQAPQYSAMHELKQLNTKFICT